MMCDISEKNSLLMISALCSVHRMYNEHLTANRAIATKKLATLTIQLRVEAFFA